MPHKGSELSQLLTKAGMRELQTQIGTLIQALVQRATHDKTITRDRLREVLSSLAPDEVEKASGLDPKRGSSYGWLFGFLGQTRQFIPNTPERSVGYSNISWRHLERVQTTLVLLRVWDHEQGRREKSIRDQIYVGGQTVLWEFMTSALRAVSEVKSDANGSWYDAKIFKLLLEQVGPVCQPYIRQYLHYYLEPLRNGSTLGGRNALVHEIIGWLKEGTAKRVFVTGPTGRGKTTFLLFLLAHIPDDWSVAFVPITNRFGRNYENIFYESLANQLAQIGGLGNTQQPHVLDIIAPYRRPCLGALRQLETTDKKVVIVIDGLDECSGWKVDTALFEVEPDRRIHFIVAARSLGGAARDFSQQISSLNWVFDERRTRYLELPLIEMECVEEALRLLGYNLDDDQFSQSDIARITATSQGDPLLISYLAQEYLSMKPPESSSRSTVVNLTPDIGDPFERWFWQQLGDTQDTSQTDRHLQDAMLAVLATARGPLWHSELEAVCGIYLDKSILALSGFDFGPLARLIRGDGVSSPYAFQNPRFAEAFRKGHFKAGAAIDRASAAFAKWAVQTVCAVAENRKRNVPLYLMQHSIAHIVGNKTHIDNIWSLMSPDWYRAVYQQYDNLSRYAADLTELMSTIKDCEWLSAKSALAISLGCAIIISSLRSVCGGLPIELLVQMVRNGKLSGPEAMARLRMRGRSCSSRALASLFEVAEDGTKQAIISWIPSLYLLEERLQAYVGIAAKSHPRIRQKLFPLILDELRNSADSRRVYVLVDVLRALLKEGDWGSVHTSQFRPLAESARIASDFWNSLADSERDLFCKELPDYVRRSGYGNDPSFLQMFALVLHPDEFSRIALNINASKLARGMDLARSDFQNIGTATTLGGNRRYEEEIDQAQKLILSCTNGSYIDPMERSLAFLQYVRQTDTRRARHDLIAGAAPAIAVDFLHEALAIVEMVGDDAACIEAIGSLASLLPPQKAKDAKEYIVREADKIKSDSEREEATIILGRYVPDSLDVALQSLSFYRKWASRHLQKLALNVPSEQAHLVFEVASRSKTFDFPAMVIASQRASRSDVNNVWERIVCYVEQVVGDMIKGQVVREFVDFISKPDSVPNNVKERLLNASCDIAKPLERVSALSYLYELYPDFVKGALERERTRYGDSLIGLVLEIRLQNRVSNAYPNASAERLLASSMEMLEHNPTWVICALVYMFDWPVYGERAVRLFFDIMKHKLQNKKSRVHGGRLLFYACQHLPPQYLPLLYDILDRFDAESRLAALIGATRDMHSSRPHLLKIFSILTETERIEEYAFWLIGACELMNERQIRAISDELPHYLSMCDRKGAVAALSLLVKHLALDDDEYRRLVMVLCEVRQQWP